MEENKNYSELPEEKDSIENGETAADAAADGNSAAESVAETEAATEAAPEEAAEEEPAVDEAPVAPEWSFGGEADVAARASNKRGTRTFIILFAAVFAVCILLLGLS